MPLHSTTEVPFFYLHKDEAGSLQTGKHGLQYSGIEQALNESSLDLEKALLPVKASSKLWEFSFEVQHQQNVGDIQYLINELREEDTFKLLKNTPGKKAILAPNDVMATMVILMLENTGLTIPDDVQVTGFDGINPLQHYLGTHSLTTLTAPLKGCGSKAAEILLQHLADSPEIPIATHNYTLPVELYWGNTTSIS